VAEGLKRPNPSNPVDNFKILHDRAVVEQNFWSMEGSNTGTNDRIDPVRGRILVAETDVGRLQFPTRPSFRASTGRQWKRFKVS
jgi:hypothetical protein